MLLQPTQPTNSFIAGQHAESAKSVSTGLLSQRGNLQYVYQVPVAVYSICVEIAVGRYIIKRLSILINVNKKTLYPIPSTAQYYTVQYSTSPANLQ
jgi:hypothetical protein